MYGRRGIYGRQSRTGTELSLSTLVLSVSFHQWSVLSGLSPGLS